MDAIDTDLSGLILTLSLLISNTNIMHTCGKTSILGFFLGLVPVLSLAVSDKPTCSYFMDVLLPYLQDESPYQFLLGDSVFIPLLLIPIVILGLILKDDTMFPLRRNNEIEDEDYEEPKPHSSKIGTFWRALFLGWMFSIGMLLVLAESEPWDSPFGIYVCILTTFHFSEFLITSITSPLTLSSDSFLLNHSRAYTIAAVASWIEYGIELYFLPTMKTIPAITGLGLALCLIGEVVRKLAMLTAMQNFTHVIREKKVEGHKLITHGIFRICRHPSYGGWFWWSIGTQIILCNPICVIAYTIASWNFFCFRITYEEATLLAFFGHQYSQYQKNVPRTGIPMVSGYIPQ